MSLAKLDRVAKLDSDPRVIFLRYLDYQLVVKRGSVYRIIGVRKPRYSRRVHTPSPVQNIGNEYLGRVGLVQRSGTS
jgi:hypothetical protein